MGLIDVTAIRTHLTALHRHAAAVMNGINRRAVIQLCTKFPDAPGMCVSAFDVGDVDHMVQATMRESRCGRNCYCEARLVRPGLPKERGKAHATLAVFALVADHDSDRNRAGRINPDASLTVETSPPANVHQWFLLKQPLDVDTAKSVGDQLRKLIAADSCTAVPTGCFRVGGSPNFVDQAKIDRGRVITPTRLIGVSNKVWSVDELIASFAKPAPRRNSLLELKVSRPATPAMDRSAVFMSCIHMAIAAGWSPDDLESLMRQHPDGCAQNISKPATGCRRKSSAPGRRLSHDAPPARLPNMSAAVPA
jgi:hypothetical protein